MLCARKLNKLVPRHARAVRTAVVRLGDECVRLSFERSDTVLCVDPPAPACTSVANCCHLRAGCSRTVRMGWCKASGKVLTLVSAPNCAVGSDRSVHCAVQGCASNAHGCRSGCNESVQQMCEHPDFGRVRVATEVTALWRRSGDRRALRTLELLAMELRTKDSGLSVGRKLGELSAGDLPQPDLWTADDAHLWFGRFTSSWGRHPSELLDERIGLLATIEPKAT